jgi:lysophospholipase L1-like esterase
MRRFILVTTMLALAFMLGAATVRYHVKQRVIATVFGGGKQLTSWPGKSEIPCPIQTSRSAVFLVFGQSNAANMQSEMHTAIDRRVVNHFNGRCYLAASPLLGAYGERGESWTLLGNKLVAAGVFDQVIIEDVAVGGSEIKRWSDGDLTPILDAAALDLTQHYRVTHVLFHQGERDFGVKTSKADYETRFRGLIARLRKAKISAPIYICVASYESKYAGWAADNPVTEAQHDLVNGADILAGPDTDAIVLDYDRYDGSHFNGSGQEKFAAAWAQILSK